MSDTSACYVKTDFLPSRAVEIHSEIDSGEKFIKCSSIGALDRSVTYVLELKALTSQTSE